MFRPSSAGQADYYGFCWLLPNIRKLLFSSPAPGFRPVRDGRSPRVMRVTFVPNTRRIYSRTLWMVIGLWSHVPSRPDTTASYAISVRRARTLPAASFRFRLTTDTLAVRLTVPTIRVR